MKTEPLLGGLLNYWKERGELVLWIGGSFVMTVAKILGYAIVGMLITYPVVSLTGDGRLSVETLDLMLMGFVIWYPSALFSLILVSGGRLLHYLKNCVPRYWRRNTPPYEPIEDPDKSVASEEDLVSAQNALSKNVFRGLATFVIMYFTFLYIAFFRSGSFYDTVESVEFEGVVTVLSSVFSPIQGIAYILAQSNISRGQLILLTMLVVIPGLAFAPAIRNQQYIFENRIRKEFNENGIRGSQETILYITTSVLVSMMLIMSFLQVF